MSFKDEVKKNGKIKMVEETCIFHFKEEVKKNGKIKIHRNCIVLFDLKMLIQQTF